MRRFVAELSLNFFLFAPITAVCVCLCVDMFWQCLYSLMLLAFLKSDAIAVDVVNFCLHFCCATAVCCCVSLLNLMTLKFVCECSIASSKPLSHITHVQRNKKAYVASSFKSTALSLFPMSIRLYLLQIKNERIRRRRKDNETHREFLLNNTHTRKKYKILCTSAKRTPTIGQIVSIQNQ